MSADFVLTLTAPKEHGLETFDTDASIWSATDAGKISVSRYTGDFIRDSVMKIQGPSWTLGDGKTLGDGMYLSDSLTGMGEGAYRDFTVTAGIRYAFSCLYKMSVGALTIQLHDQTSDTAISSVNRTGTIWESYETSIVAPAGCGVIRVKLLQSGSDARSGPFYIDNVSLNGNVLLYDPDNYSRIPERLGSLHQTLGGRRVYDLRAIHYSLYLGWNVFEEDQYESLREIYYSNELLYFDDGDVPPLIESEVVYETAEYNYEGIANPSGTHRAYSDSSSSLPSSKSDFETTEFATADYDAIDGDDTSYKETADPSSGEYLYHKLLLLSSIDRDGVRRFRVKVKMSSGDSSPQGLDGGLLYAWNGTNWVELARNTNSAITELTYSTAESEVAMQFVDSGDNYIRLLLRSRNRRDGANNLSLRTYYVECEINEGLDLTIGLSHKAILDENDDVIWVKNLTQGTALLPNFDYTVSTDRRSVDIDGGSASLDGSSKYFSGGNVLNASTYDISISAWIKTTADSSEGSIVTKCPTLSSTGYAFTYYYGANKLYFYINGTNGPSPALSINDGKWHHVAVVADRSSDATFYVDGEAVGAIDISEKNGVSTDSAANIQIGKTTGWMFNGNMCDVKIYIADDDHWSAAQVLYQYNNPFDYSANSGPMTSYWLFTDDASATNADTDGMITDGSGLGNHLDAFGGDTANYGTHSRAIPISSGNEIEVKYNRYFEVMFASIPEEWFSGYSSNENRLRSVEVVIQTLSASM